MDSDRLDLAYLGDPNSIHTRRWAGWFAEAGHRVRLLVPDRTDLAPGLHPAIEVEVFRPYGRGRGPLRGALAARRSLRERLRAMGPVILHAHYLTTAGWHGWLAGWHPFVVTVWGSDVYRNTVSTRGRLQARLVLGRADLVTADSADLLRATVRVGARAERIQLVQFGIDMSRFEPALDTRPLRTRLGLEGRRVVFSPRTIAPLYRQLTVLDALAGLPEDVVGLFSAHAAREGELERLRTHAVELGVSDRIQVVAAVAYEDMPGYYALADVVVSVPESDATPVTMLEALAMGRPVVASDLPSVRALVQPIDPRAMVPVGDAAATRAAIEERLAWTPERRDAHAVLGRATVAAIADQATNMRRVEALYRELSGRRPS